MNHSLVSFRPILALLKQATRHPNSACVNISSEHWKIKSGNLQASQCTTSRSVHLRESVNDLIYHYASGSIILYSSSGRPMPGTNTTASFTASLLDRLRGSLLVSDIHQLIFKLGRTVASSLQLSDMHGTDFAFFRFLTFFPPRPLRQTTSRYDVADSEGRL